VRADNTLNGYSLTLCRPEVRLVEYVGGEVYRSGSVPVTAVSTLVPTGSATETTSTDVDTLGGLSVGNGGGCIGLNRWGRKGEMMAMRNWWIEATIDGRKTKLAGGPQAKNGGFTLTVQQRSKGKSVEVMGVRGVIEPDGTLHLIQSGPESGGDYRSQR
jgi:hypothetical protein